jgi:thioredoxin-related protein
MNSRGIKQALDITASIACVIVCALLVTSVASNYFRTRANANAERRTVSEGLQLGTKFPAIPGLDYKQHDKSILFFVSAECSHCIQNLPIYQRIFEKSKATPRSTQALIGLFENQKEYTDFAARGFSIPGKGNILFYTYNIRATPTIVVVDRGGNIRNFWIGELTTKAEEALTHIVGSST